MSMGSAQHSRVRLSYLTTTILLLLTMSSRFPSTALLLLPRGRNMKSQQAVAAVAFLSSCYAMSTNSFGMRNRLFTHQHSKTSLEAGKGSETEQDKKEETDSSSSSSSSFDIRDFWRANAEATNSESDSTMNPSDFWSKIFTSEKNVNQSSEGKQNDDDEGGIYSKMLSFVLGESSSSSSSSSNNSSHKKDSSKESQRSSSFEGISNKFLKLIAGDDDKGDTISDIVSTVRERAEQDGDVEDTSSVNDILAMLQHYGNSLDGVVSKFLGDIDFSRITPSALLYFLEHQDEAKNPSYKRRKHRFCAGIDASKADELYSSLLLAQLAYSDTIEEIQQGLEEHATPHKLVYCRIESMPGKPAYFLAVKRDQPSSFLGFNTTLDVTLVVRGTKTVADAITDLLCDETDYRGGKAHSFILNSGKWVAEECHDLLLDLLESSGKSSIQLHIIGHSLGAATASICGIELNALEDRRIGARVTGFGCPSLLSKELAEKSDFITTVVNDDDCVPRLNGISVANLLLDVIEFDWLPYAKKDIRSAVEELQYRQPYIFNENSVAKILETVEPLMEKHLRQTIMEQTKNRLDVLLYPPGRCVHFYRDGVGVSACYVPNTFFSEIDVSRKMIADHLFDSGYVKTLLDVERQRTGDLHFSFNSVDESK